MRRLVFWTGGGKRRRLPDFKCQPKRWSWRWSESVTPMPENSARVRMGTSALESALECGVNVWTDSRHRMFCTMPLGHRGSHFETRVEQKEEW